MTRWPIPMPLAVDWPQRDVASARISSSDLDDGRYRQIVEHAPLPGIDPAMCLWYLEHVDREVEWRGQNVLAYRLWHPRDHIFFRRKGPFAPGGRWHIVEAFGAERRFLLDGVFHVTKLDESGFTMEIRRLGQVVAHVDESWTTDSAGLHWTVTMTAGSSRPGFRSLTRRIVARRTNFLHRWRQHNVEEAGNLPHFLPELYAELGP